MIEPRHFGFNELDVTNFDGLEVNHQELKRFHSDGNTVHEHMVFNSDFRLGLAEAFKEAVQNPIKPFDDASKKKRIFLIQPSLKEAREHGFDVELYEVYVILLRGTYYH